MQSVPARRGGWGPSSIFKLLWLWGVPEQTNAAGASAWDTRAGIATTVDYLIMKWKCRGTESNCRHMDFQSTALPPELPRQPYLAKPVNISDGHVRCQQKLPLWKENPAGLQTGVTKRLYAVFELLAFDRAVIEMQHEFDVVEFPVDSLPLGDNGVGGQVVGQATELLADADETVAEVGRVGVVPRHR